MAHLNLEELNPDVKDEISNLHNEECMSSWTGTTNTAPSIVHQNDQVNITALSIKSVGWEDDQPTIPTVSIKADTIDLNNDMSSPKDIPSKPISRRRPSVKIPESDRSIPTSSCNHPTVSLRHFWSSRH